MIHLNDRVSIQVEVMSSNDTNECKDSGLRGIGSSNTVYPVYAGDFKIEIFVGTVAKIISSIISEEIGKSPLYRDCKYFICLDEVWFPGNNTFREEVDMDGNNVSGFWVTDKHVMKVCSFDVYCSLTTTPLRVRLQHLWKDIVFRRVGKTTLRLENFSEGEYLKHDSTSLKFPNFEDYIKQGNEEKREMVGIEKYKYWYGSTTRTQLRRNDRYDGNIWFDPYGFSEIEIEDGSMTFSHKQKNAKSVTVPPLQGSLVCGWVRRAKKGLVFWKWFKCSEQFMKLWTIVMYNPHEVYPRRNRKEQIIRRLRCNNSKVWLQNNSDATDEEKEKRYRVIRTEFVSDKWVGIYQAIARYVVYGDCPEDIRKDIEKEYSTGEHKIEKWLPEEYDPYPESILSRIRENILWMIP